MTKRADTLYDGAIAELRDIELTDSASLDRLFAHVKVIYDELLAGGGGGGAPTNATYVTITSNATLTNEVLYSALAPNSHATSHEAAGSDPLSDNSVTYAKIQNVSAASRLLGRGSAGGAGDPEEITLGAGLTMAGTSLSASGGGGSGVAEVDFGAWPGKTDTTLAITGQASILSGSVVQAWLYPKATTNHSLDEHAIEEIDVYAGNIVAATGFTIYANTRRLPLYGLYSVAWRWS